MQVTWDQNLCCHAGVCVRSLPEVFKIDDDRFVIDAPNASDEEIAAVVNQCPSGALQVAKDNK